MHLASTQEDLGDRNRRVVLSEILLHGPISRSVIAERIGLTPASVSRITRNLIDAGLIEEGGQDADSTGRGRKSIQLSIRPNGGYIAGISINVFSQDIVIADLANGEVAHKRMRFQDLDDARQVLVQCAESLLALLDKSGIQKHQLIGCSVVIAGAVDPISQTLRSSPFLEWDDVDIRSVVGGILDIPLAVESNANAKTLAAHCFGPAKGVGNVALVNASLGVCASLFVDGKLMRGSAFSAGLIESMLVPGELASGLLPVDQIAGGFAFVDRKKNSDENNGAHFASQLVEAIHAANNGEPTATKKFHMAGRALGFVVAQVNALLHPDQVLISGPLIESDDYCEGIRSRLGELVSEEFVTDKLRFFRISNQGTAQSFSVYHFLVRGESEWGRTDMAQGF